MSGPEWPFVLVGVLASAVCGCAIPVYALFFGDVLAVSGRDWRGSGQGDGLRYCDQGENWCGVASVVSFCSP